MSYRRLLANLEALPEGERQLAAHTYAFLDENGREVCGCVLGKAIPELRALSGEDADGVGWQGHVIEESVFRAAGITPETYGLTITEASRAQRANDAFHEPNFRKNAPEARRARYTHMIRWLRARVAEDDFTSAASAAPAAPKAVRPLRAGGKEEA